jgi:Skp family chaperone for outer membrane proteins
MKKFILILIVITGNFSAIKAQDENGTKAERIEALKIAFITQKLQLTPDEAQKFWPVYNQYQNDLRSLQLDYKNGPALENEEKLLNIRKKYATSFEKVIGPQKLNRLFNAERDFRTILIRRLQNRNQQRMSPLRR